MQHQQQDTALDRALRRPNAESPPVDWRVVQRIIGRQYSPQTVQNSLERIAEEPLLPMDVFLFTVDKVIHGNNNAGNGGGNMGNHHRDSTQCLYRAIRNIWRRTLVDRGIVAFHASTQAALLRPRADVEYEKQLVAIENSDDLAANLYLSTAFQKTKCIVQALQAQEGGVLPRTIPLVHAMIEAKLPPFLIFLAAREDPTSITETTCPKGRLALHAAMAAHLVCQRNYQTDDSHRIRFSPPSAKQHEATSQKWLNLFQRNSPVYLLCHLHPKAAFQSDLPNRMSKSSSSSSSSSYVPLETFLYTLPSLTDSRTVTTGTTHQWHSACVLSQLGDIIDPILQDVRRVLKICPQILETRHPHHGLWPFLVPMLCWDSFQEDHHHAFPRHPHPVFFGELDPLASKASASSASSSSSSVAQNFLLTLSYTLLRENPMVIGHSYDTNTVKLAPCTVYERVLEERLELITETTIPALLTHQESLKRQIAELVSLEEEEEENEQDENGTQRRTKNKR